MSDYSDTSSSPEPDSAQLPAGLQEILYRLRPITGVSYNPFKYEPKQPAKALLPTSFLLKKRHPFDYFSLFFTPNLFHTITTNTNRYASLQQIQVNAIIYIGNTDFNKGPLHSITTHISLYRFKQIKRYYHISYYESNKRAGYFLPKNKKWWYKLKPLASLIQASSQ
ncbi:hypothetical protein N431DRAFT_496766 [Stipitochalara longipes BDJ]|nr:hypothetical protein N431DRAFT_496766 [Stipitochalara longipes BDJ]